MSRPESITIREVESSDLKTFYEHQLDPEATRMAAFVGRGEDTEEYILRLDLDRAN